jgi:cytochrome c oxidase subunit 2
MDLEFYERIWMWGASVLLLVFLSIIFLTAGMQAVHPASHIETVDPTKLAEHPEFGNPTVTIRPEGVTVTLVAQMFSFSPDPIEVPAHRPVTFRATSSDVLHGFYVVGTNANAMLVPGYVSQFTVTFDKPGEYVIACNEFCGPLHHAMVGKLIVKEPQ